MDYEIVDSDSGGRGLQHRGRVPDDRVKWIGSGELGIDFAEAEMESGEEAASALRGDASNSKLVTTPQTVALTFIEAGAATGLHPSSLRRRHKNGAFPNAYRTPGGPWRIPIADLLSAGIELRRPADGLQDDALGEIQQLRDRLSEVTHRAQVAEAALRVRELQVLDLRRSLRMLQPPRPEALSDERSSVPPQVAHALAAAIQLLSEIAGGPNHLEETVLPGPSGEARTRRWLWQRRKKIPWRRTPSGMKVQRWVARALPSVLEVVGALLILTVSFAIDRAYAFVGGIVLIIAAYLALPTIRKRGLVIRERHRPGVEGRFVQLHTNMARQIKAGEAPAAPPVGPSEELEALRAAAPSQLGVVRWIGHSPWIMVLLAVALTLGVATTAMNVLLDHNAPVGVTKRSSGSFRTQEQAPSGALVMVPDVRGLSALRARAKLVQAGLRLERVLPTRGTPGEVRMSRPAPGLLVSPGSPVILLVGATSERLGGS